MLKTSEEGGLESAQDSNGNFLISDTDLQENVLFNLRPNIKPHKQVYGWEVCTKITEYD